MRYWFVAAISIGCSQGGSFGEFGVDGDPKDASAADTFEEALDANGSERHDAHLEDRGSLDGTSLDASENSGCSVAGRSRDCVDLETCEGTPFLSRCDGPPREVCCFEEVACSVRGAPGLCLDVASCTATSTPGLCPGPANIQCCTRAEDACDERAKPTPNEGLLEETYDPSCPPGMMPSVAFCIDRFEASLVYADGRGSWSPYVNPGDTSVRAVSLPYAVPQAYISGVQAAAACRQADKRLCTDAEWLSACRGPSQRTYPYGDTREDGRCNDARSVHPAIEYFGSSDPSVFAMLGHPCIDQLPSSLDLTGRRAGCESEAGTFDMMGNLHEWTSDPSGTFRGGFYVDTRQNGEGCLYVTTAHDSSYWDYSTGFRCCADRR